VSASDRRAAVSREERAAWGRKVPTLVIRFIGKPPYFLIFFFIVPLRTLIAGAA
jgi:hypothetical protein